MSLEISLKGEISSINLIDINGNVSFFSAGLLFFSFHPGFTNAVKCFLFSVIEMAALAIGQEKLFTNIFN